MLPFLASTALAADVTFTVVADTQSDTSDPSINWTVFPRSSRT